MDRNQLCQIKRHVHIALAPAWLASVLLHVLVWAVALKIVYIPPAKNDIVSISLTNFVLPVSEFARVPQKLLLPEQFQPVPPVSEATELAAKPDNREELKVPGKQSEKQPDKQAVAQNITIEPKVSPPKPPAPLKIKSVANIKQKFSKPSDSAQVALLVKQPIRAVSNPMPPASPQVKTTPVEAKKNPEVAQDKYLHANFNGIRSKVNDNLQYPAMARRQGWSGQVQVRFVILLSGKIDKLEVLSSSGHALLDSQALRAIKSAAPFPVPPVVASITIPVMFELH